MSDDLHADLEEFYDTVGGDEDQWEDEDDDPDQAGGGPYRVMIDPDDFFGDEDDDDYIFEDDIGENYDDDDDDEEDDEDYEQGESDEDMGNATLIGEGGQGDDGSSEAFITLRNLIYQSNANATANEDGNEGDDIDLDGTSLLQRILAGGGGVTTSGRNSQAILRRLANENNRTRRGKDAWYKKQIEPDPKGMELLKSGEFGRIGQWNCNSPAGKKRPRGNERWMKAWTGPKITSAHARAMVPNTPGTIVATYPSVPYVGQFAREDYSLFYTATQYFTLHLYSMNRSKKTIPNKRTRSKSQQPVLSPVPSAAAEEEENEDDYETEDDDDEDQFQGWARNRGGMLTEDTSLKRIKRVQGVEGSWTVTDCDADKKGEKMIYSSITPYVHMLYTAETDQEHTELNFSAGGRDSMWGYDRFGIWSIRFSADGKEVVAGASGGRIMVYDIEAERRSLAVQGHADDVNAVSFADESSTNILVSGSDDGYVKVWDRRSLSSSTPSGILVGATEGITYTSPKGDGRYIVVNSKDQAARLYDLRKMANANDFETEPDAVAKYGQPRFDYRSMDYPRPNRLAHPKDCSIMTYRGHSVLNTLIRCHFSPRESTGQSYIYSGSADGLIHIWSLDGRVLNRAESLPLRNNGQYTDPSSYDPASATSGRNTGNDFRAYGGGKTVRDVAWHGYEPTLMSTCWESNGHFRKGGNVAKHEWKGLNKGGLNRLEDWVEKKRSENSAAETESGWLGNSSRMPGGLSSSLADWNM
ncbi:uncharacterized protein IL334_000074 [Kwoniella shivajii]|uniref:WD40 repeat-like protein n=1 Tax=Kwoniella shivajii TaxID=564305 RepID=A0ABZ1CR64_9TREE|nr:hypothetical protein IL334_000074 [Kwoniella shivajii]